MGLCIGLMLTPCGWAWAAEPVAGAPAPQISAEPSLGAPNVLTIDDAYQLTLKTHEQIRIAEKELEKARLQPFKAWTLLTPRAAFVGRYTRYSRAESFQTTSQGGGGAGALPPEIFPLNLFEGDFQVVQPIFDKTFLTRKQAASDILDSGRYNLRFTAKEILFKVAGAYYNVLKAQSLVEVAQQTLGLAKDSLRVAEARFRVGEETKTAVLRAEVDVAKAERDVTRTTNNLKLQRAVLGNLINREPTFEVIAPQPVAAAGETLKAYQDLAFKCRDDLKIQIDNLRLAKYNRDLVREELYPNANATFTYARVTPQTLVQLDDFWNLAVALNVPIFEGGLTYVNLKEAGKSIKQAELRVDDLKKQIAIEVEDAYLQVQTLASTLVTLQKQAELAAENYNITFKQFQVGVATSLDVTDALTSLNSARTDLANERYNYQVALLNLQRVTGTFGLAYTASLAPEVAGQSCLGIF